MQRVDLYNLGGLKMFFDTHVCITLPEQKVLHHQLNIEEYVEILTNQQKGIGILL